MCQCIVLSVTGLAALYDSVCVYLYQLRAILSQTHTHTYIHIYIHRNTNTKPSPGYIQFIATQQRASIQSIAPPIQVTPSLCCSPVQRPPILLLAIINIIPIIQQQHKKCPNTSLGSVRSLSFIRFVGPKQIPLNPTPPSSLPARVHHA